jgi:hypothetical protein
MTGLAGRARQGIWSRQRHAPLRRQIPHQLRISPHLSGRALERDPSAVEHVGVVRNAQRKVEVLLDDDDGDVFRELDQATAARC